MRFLRTNTATRITVGPFLDKTDGITPEVALTVTSEKLTLVVDTGGVPTLVLDVAPTASAGSNDMVHITGDDAGYYDLELAAADVNYLGRAVLSLNDAATHCPVFHEFMIIPAMIYDSLILGTDKFDVNVTHVTDTAQTAKDIGAAVPAAAAGASGGLLISGSNSGTTTLGALTVSGATTLTGAFTATNASNSVTGVGVTSNIKKNQALAAFEFLMTDSTNHNPATGKTVTVTRSINGAAFGAGTLSAVTEVSAGIYSVDFGAGDLNGNVITLRATATGCDDTFVTIITEP